MDIKHQEFKVSDFLSWQREGTLELSPSFQRRPVWKKPAKSFLIDTVVRNLPVPVVFVREKLDLEKQTTVREVVDGQQRLRTLFSFIDPECLKDLDEDRDVFQVLRKHNSEIADRNFSKLSNELKRRILSYEFSTHVLPSETEDRDVLAIFARMNSTGYQLNSQELRNAKYFGAFKTSMYELALEQLDRWRTWRIFSEEQIARMLEAELASDLTMTMINGAVSGKSKARLDAIYDRFDDDFPQEQIVVSRFHRVMDIIEECIGDQVGSTVYSSEVYFYTLFTFVCDLVFGLEDQATRAVTGKRISVSRLRNALLWLDEIVENDGLPLSVSDAFNRASADTGRRQSRQDYLAALYNDTAR